MNEFIIIGENIHTTRSVKLDGIRTFDLDGEKVITFRKKGDDFSILNIPDHFKGYPTI